LKLKKEKQIHIFAKGGDSKPCNTPELELCRKLGIEVKFGVGGKKIQSSSNILRLNED
jgi:D-beta-D-heptose 7-phosphate kinase/D-beta-D-heptose 1-phosphate adenosyltransferase